MGERFLRCRPLTGHSRPIAAVQTLEVVASKPSLSLEEIHLLSEFGFNKYSLYSKVARRIGASAFGIAENVLTNQLYVTNLGNDSVDIFSGATGTVPKALLNELLIAPNDVQ